MKTRFHIATAQYCFLEVEGTEKDLPKMEKIYQDYAEYPVVFKKGVFVETETFTGEKILYDKENHVYTDLDGNKLISGSQFAKRFEKPFDKEAILPKMAEKTGVLAKDIDEYWTMNGKISADFGSAGHLLMECWFKNRGTAIWKDPKHPFLADTIKTFPYKDDKREAITEAMISNVKVTMVGQCDLLLKDNDENYEIVDYKFTSEEAIKKDFKKYAMQLNFYRHILESKGFPVTKMTIANHNDGWSMHDVVKMDLKTGEPIINNKTYEEGKKGSIEVTSAKSSKSASNKSAGLPRSDVRSDEQHEGTKK